ncbi:MAG: hypothetical protein J6T70_01810 [Bacteroidales bacterium]|nr:hypothetical protein [Bacteroidales bacterium]
MMNNSIIIIFAAICFAVSCGPSAQEQQAMVEKAKSEVRDSIEHAKRMADSIVKSRNDKRDSIAKEEEKRQAIEDSLNTNVNSRRWVYEKRNDPKQTIIATLKSEDDSLTIQVLDYLVNGMRGNEINFYCDKLHLNSGLFRGKSSIQVKFDKSRAIEYVIVENGVDCAKIRNLYTYVQDFKKSLLKSKDFEICFPTSDGWKTYQFSPEEVLNFENVQ